MVEKLFLVGGLIRFFDLPVRLRGFVVATLLIELWLHMHEASSPAPARA